MANDLLKKCLNNGIRITNQRQIILGVIKNSEDHQDVDQPYRRDIEEDIKISIATVYRTVKLLEEACFIHRLEFGDGWARYEESGEHHENLVRLKLARLLNFFSTSNLKHYKEQIAREMGYQLGDHRLELLDRKSRDTALSYGLLIGLTK